MALRTDISNLLGSIGNLLHALVDIPSSSCDPSTGLPFEPTSFWAKMGNAIVLLLGWAILVQFLVLVAVPSMTVIWCMGKFLNLVTRTDVMNRSLFECIDFAMSGEILDHPGDR